MDNDYLKIKDASDEQIILLVELCYFMFNSHNINDRAVSAFVAILKNKFPLLTFGKIQQLCTDAAANPPKSDVRFTPSFLAVILQSAEKKYIPSAFVERELTREGKLRYRQQFLKDLYADFDAYKNDKENGMKNILVWDYVARQLVNSGFAERLPEVKETTAGAIGDGNLRNIFSSHLPFVKQCFDKIMDNGKHISDYINGIR